MEVAPGLALEAIIRHMPDGWQADVTEGGRIYYISHQNRLTQWTPPIQGWQANDGLPYGWESAIDKQGNQYFINHVDKLTSAENPEDDPDYVPPPQPRVVELKRDPKLGFGFVAGSEKPVIVRFVTEGGPSQEKLLPGDQLIKINGEDIKKAPREYVIDLVRSSDESMVLTVCQPYSENAVRKSAFLTAAKRARLKSHPSRVRFAQSVIVNGAPESPSSDQESYIPFMPNVLKVFLENNQTKSFKYDNKTIVKEVLLSLQEKLGIVNIDHFALALQNGESRHPSHGHLTLLQDHECLADIASRPGSTNFKCLFRVSFVPKDPYDLLRADSNAFEYFYMQCCNDVIEDRFSSELRYDVAFRLAALHMQQYVAVHNMQHKLSIKAVERECGLERFVPRGLLNSIKRKEARKLLSHHVKQCQLLEPGQKLLSPLQAKLHYMKIVSELRSFGGRCFMATVVDRRIEAMLLVGPKCGVALVTNIKNNTLHILSEFDQLDYMTVHKEDGLMVEQVHLHVISKISPVRISLMSDDVQNFITLVEGYYRVFVDENRSLLRTPATNNNNSVNDRVPPYHGVHDVIPTTWTYSDSEASQSRNSTESLKENEAPTDDDNLCTTKREDEGGTVAKRAKQDPNTQTKTIDLSIGPPPYRAKNYANANGKLKLEISSPIISPCVDSDPLLSTNAPLASPDISSCSEVGANTCIPQTIPKPIPTGDHVTGDVTNTSTSVQSNDTSVQYSCDNHAVTDGGATRAAGDADGGAAHVKGLNTGLTSPHGNPARHLVTSDSLCSTDTQSTLEDQDDTCDEDEWSVPISSPQPSVTRRFSRSNSSSLYSSDTISTTSSRPEHSDDDDEDEEPLGTDAAPEDAGNIQDNDLKTPEQEIASNTTNTGEHTAIGRLSHTSHVDGNVLTNSEDSLVHSESSDTDSMSTPTTSPVKARLRGVNVTPPQLFKQAQRPHSFGLHSPDQLPKSEIEFRKIANSFGLQSPTNNDTTVTPPDADGLHPSYNPRLFCDGGLYLDPDIIDLTLIPPPKTPEHEYLIDFSSTSERSPPAAFSDAGGLPHPRPSTHTTDDSSVNGHHMTRDSELGQQMAALDALMIEDTNLRRILDTGNIENESDSGNETISSENVDMSSTTLGDSYTLDNSCDMETMISEHMATDDLDIEAFIASMTVPPPPSCDSPDLDFPPPPTLGFARASSIMSPDNELPPPPPPTDITPPDMTDLCIHADASNHVSGFPPPDVVLSTGNVPYVERNGTSDAEVSHLEDEFAMLVIPPPPESSKSPIDICIVPPLLMSPISQTTSPESVKSVTSPHDNGDHTDDATKPVSQTINIYNLKSAQVSPPCIVESEPLPRNIEISDNTEDTENLLNAPKGVKSSVSIESLKERDFGTVAEIKNKLLGAKTKKGALIPNGNSNSPAKESKKKERAPRPKHPPPPPPQRLTSLMSSQHSAPCSPTETVTADPLPLDISQRKALLWRPSDVRSADNSPVHRCRDLPGASSDRLSVAGRRNAPAPPPRRSSMSMSACSTPTATPPLTPNSNKESPEILHLGTTTHPLQFSTFKRNAGSNNGDHKNNLINVYKSEQSDTESNLLKMLSGGVGGGGVGGGGVGEATDSNIGTSGIKTHVSRLSYINNSKDDIDDVDTAPTSSTEAIKDEGKSSEETKDQRPISYIDELHAKAFPQGTTKRASPTMGTKLEKPVVDNVPLSTIKLRPYRSPALVRREIRRSSSQSSSGDEELRQQAIAETETTGAEDATMFASGNANGKSIVARSTSFGGAVTHSPAGHSTSGRNTISSSNRGSAVHRHSSLSRMAERAASPLRALFGSSSSSNSSGYRHRTASDSEGSPVVQRSSNSGPGNRNYMMSSSKSPSTSYRPLSTSTLPRNKDTNKKIPMKIVHPLMATPPSPDTDAAPLSTSPPPMLSPTTAEPMRTLHEPMSTFGKGATELLERHRSNSTTDVSTIGTMRSLSDSPSVVRKYDTISRMGSSSRERSAERMRAHGASTLRTTRSTSLGGDTPLDNSAFGRSLHDRPTAVISADNCNVEPKSGARDTLSDLPPPSPRLQHRGPGDMQPTSPRMSHRGPSELKTSCGGAVPQYTAVATAAAAMAAGNGTATTTGQHHTGNITESTPVQIVLGKTYTGERIFRDANDDALKLIQYLETSFLAIGRNDHKRPEQEFIECRETLVLHTRQFVTDSKLLVSSATQSRDKLVYNVNNSMHTLARIVQYAQATMRRMASITQAQSMGLRVKDVACAYRTTVNAANVAAGRPLDDPHMKLLMRQATSLASILSTLMKSLKSIANAS